MNVCVYVYVCVPLPNLVDRWLHDKDTRHSFEPSTSVRRTHTKQITCDITNATRANFDRFLCVSQSVAKALLMLYLPPPDPVSIAMLIWGRKKSRKEKEREKEEEEEKGKTTPSKEKTERVTKGK